MSSLGQEMKTYQLVLSAFAQHASRLWEIATEFITTTLVNDDCIILWASLIDRFCTRAKFSFPCCSSNNILNYPITVFCAAAMLRYHTGVHSSLLAGRGPVWIPHHASQHLPAFCPSESTRHRFWYSINQFERTNERFEAGRLCHLFAPYRVCVCMLCPSVLTSTYNCK